MSFGRVVLAWLVVFALSFGPSLATASLMPAIGVPSSAPTERDRADQDDGDHDGATKVGQHDRQGATASEDGDDPEEPLGNRAPSSPQPLPEEEEEEKHVSSPTAIPPMSQDGTDREDETAPSQASVRGLERPPRANA